MIKFLYLTNPCIVANLIENLTNYTTRAFQSGESGIITYGVSNYRPDRHKSLSENESFFRGWKVDIAL
jgi:hypothetical protein